jgi:DNA/RNA endonuclease G (NUC1)/subtilisin-like proprotein convertase family protein
MSRIGNPFAALVSRLQRARVEDQSIAPRTRPQPAPTPSETTPARPTTFSPTSLDAAHTARVGFNQADRLRANLFSMFRPAAAPTAAPTAATSAAAAAGNTQTVTASAAPNAAIRDFQTTTSTIAITEDLKTTGVRVDVNIAHSYASDLVVKLRSPEGREVLLRNREGGRGTGTVSFTANPTDFNGVSTKGNWTLVVEDRAGGDVGTLRNWSLALTGTRPAPEPPPATGGRTVTQTATPNASIRDFQTTTSTIAINDDLKTTGVRVDVNIAHTYASDLVVKLRSPQGQEVTLRNREGGRGNGTVSFTANPSDFNGTDAKGEWTLIVEDRERGDVGTLRSWSLSVTGTDRTPPPAPPRPTPPPDNSPLLLGNPSNAVPDVRQENNYLIVRDQFTASYNRADAKPNWVAWHTDRSHLGREGRGKFDENSTDNQLPEGWRRVTTFDYTGSGYDRGHHLPSADRTASREANNGTFLMTNVLPQAPDNNQGPWERMERYVRDQIRQNDMEAYTIMGSYGEVGRIPGQGGDANIAIPERVWKVVVLIPRGDNDLERINRDTQVIAVDMPNRQGIRNDNWEDYRVSVADIERATNMRFFTNLPPEVQAALREKGR